MIDLLLVPVAMIYLMVVGALFLYGCNFLYMTWLSYRLRRPAPALPDPSQWPIVTVQLPIYNELYVAERLIQAAAHLDYPPECLEIQVLDDSTDATLEVVRQAVDCCQALGTNIHHIHRTQRAGFKAGALGEGLACAQGEFLAIFDADFIPPPDFLRRTIPHFFLPSPDPRGVAFIQTRWGHANRDYSFVTFLQSLAIDAHFMVEQFARSGGDFWFNFNGTAGVWRREAILDAGGWRADTLTEDLDLSYRAFLKGWRAIYLRDVETPAELPPSFNAFRRQQHRWARGSFECAIRLLPQVWRAPISAGRKLQATLHLTGYFVHLLLFSLTLLYPLVLLLSTRYPALVSLFGIAVVFNLTAFAPSIFFLAAQAQLGRSWRRSLPVVLFVSAAGAGMMLNTLRAALQALGGRRGAFERTPKFGLLPQGQHWSRRQYQIRMDPIVWVELLLALLNIVTASLAVWMGNPLIAGYAALFSVGLFYTSGVTILQAVAVWRSEQNQ